METKKPFEVFETKNYEIFKHIDYNRDVNASNVKKIKESMTRYGLIVPIVVSSDGYVIDGQHRLEALRELQMPVWYIVSQNIKEDIVMEVNAIRKNWTMRDWVNSFANKGYLEYQKLLELFDEYRGVFGENTIADVFYHQVRSTLSIIKHGKYKCDIELGREVVKNCHKLHDRLGDKVYSAKSMRALKSIMLRNENFDIDRLIEKSKLSKVHLGYNNEYDIRSELVEVYNFKSRLSTSKIH